jgi:hypothetical protein
MPSPSGALLRLLKWRDAFGFGEEVVPFYDWWGGETRPDVPDPSR